LKTPKGYSESVHVVNFYVKVNVHLWYHLFQTQWNLCDLQSPFFLVKRHHATETLTISLLIFTENNNLKAEVSTQYFDDDTVY
jgi:hypothetical protein